MKQHNDVSKVLYNSLSNRWPLGFVLLTGLLLLFFRQQEAVQNISLMFTAIVLEAMPFMMIGAVISGLVEVFVSRETLLRWLPKNYYLALVAGAGLGLLLPVCECAIVPVVRRFMRKGMPIGVGIAFLLGGPIVNPVVAASTAVAYQFDWKIVLIRLLMGFCIALLAGWIMERVLLVQVILKKESVSAIADMTCTHIQTNEKTNGWIEKLQHACQHAALDFYDVARFFIVGAFLAAVLQTLATRQDVMVFLSQSPISNILVMMLLAFLLNLCSEADAFVAASFAGMISFSGQMAFMVLGPMLDLKLLITYFGVFRKSAMLKLIGLVILLVLLFMTGIDLVTR